MIIHNIANGTPFTFQPTSVIQSNPIDHSNADQLPISWSHRATHTDQDRAHKVIQVNTSVPQNQHEDDMSGQYCQIRKMFYHPTSECDFQRAVLDPSVENLQRLNITKADTIMAMTCARDGTLTFDEATAIQSRDE
jgi:hypothetical protein